MTETNLIIREQSVLLSFSFSKMSRPVSNNFLYEKAAEKDKHPTKVVMRRLPPNFTSDVFREEVSPLPEHNYFYFVRAADCKGPNAFSRAYINFEHWEDVLEFKKKFDGYVFLGPGGTKYPAVVEFAPFQNIPKDVTSKKKDAVAGTIQLDSYYEKFLEKTECNHTEVQSPAFRIQPKHCDKETYVTPLLKYIKERKTTNNEKLRSVRNFSRRKCHENSTVFVNSAMKKSHRGQHVRNSNRKLTFV